MATERPARTAKELLDLKRQAGVISVPPDSSVLSALRVLAERNIGAVLVMEGGRLVGIFSERDYARKGELQGRIASTTPVREVMTPEVASVAPDRSVQDCRNIMGERRIRHLPVVERDRVIGVLSSKDVLDQVIAEDKKVIKNLEIDRLCSTTDTGGY
jgi:CBS domain-containing protein